MLVTLKSLLLLDHLLYVFISILFRSLISSSRGRGSCVRAGAGGAGHGYGCVLTRANSGHQRRGYLLADPREQRPRGGGLVGESRCEQGGERWRGMGVQEATAWGREWQPDPQESGC